jgi:dienelactone hydrolase
MGRVVEYLGYTHTGLRLLDDIRAISVLASFPGVDASRLGAVGLSEGGKRTLFLAAFDQRVRTAVVSGYFTTIRDEVAVWDRLGGWDLCNALPGLLHVADLPDIAALIAPRPLLIQNGRDDRLYDLDAVQAGFARLSKAYAGIQARRAVALDLFDGGHRFVHDGPESWLTQWLAPVQVPEGRGG